VDGAISRDRIARFLAGEYLSGQSLWLRIKKLARQSYICVNIRVCKMRASETQPRLQSLRGKITDLLGVIEESDGIAVRF
jgi:hypothetical protein